MRRFERPSQPELDALATRIAANPQAVNYVSKFITFNGEIKMPVLTMHTTGDGLVEPTAEQVGPSAFIEFKPTQHLRPFDARNLGDEGGNSGDQ